MNQLFQGDNLEILHNMPGGSVDLICTDPPYNLRREVENGGIFLIIPIAHHIKTSRHTNAHLIVGITYAKIGMDAIRIASFIFYIILLTFGTLLF